MTADQRAPGGEPHHHRHRLLQGLTYHNPSPCDVNRLSRAAQRSQVGAGWVPNTSRPSPRGQTMQARTVSSIPIFVIFPFPTVESPRCICSGRGGPLSPAALFLPLRDTPHGPGSGWPEGPDGAIVASPCWAIDVCGSHALIFGTGDPSNRATSDMHGTRKEHGSNGWPSATPRDLRRMDAKKGCQSIGEGCSTRLLRFCGSRPEARPRRKSSCCDNGVEKQAFSLFGCDVRLQTPRVRRHGTSSTCVQAEYRFKAELVQD